MGMEKVRAQGEGWEVTAVREEPGPEEAAAGPAQSGRPPEKAGYRGEASRAFRAPHPLPGWPSISWPLDAALKLRASPRHPLGCHQEEADTSAPLHPAPWASVSHLPFAPARCFPGLCPPWTRERKWEEAPHFL